MATRHTHRSIASTICIILLVLSITSLATPTTIAYQIEKDHPPARWSLWSLYHHFRYDMFWLSFYLVVNGIFFYFRCVNYSQDSCVKWSPAIAKGSAEVIMFNCILTLLAVCLDVVDRLRLVQISIRWRALLVFPIEKHRQLHILTGTMVMLMSFVHTFAWLWIIYSSHSCTIAAWRESSLYHLGFLRETKSMLHLFPHLPVWSGVFMVACIILVLPFCITWVRRHHFKLFARGHVLLLIPFLSMLLVRYLECQFSMMYEVCLKC